MGPMVFLGPSRYKTAPSDRRRVGAHTERHREMRREVDGLNNDLALRDESIHIVFALEVSRRSRSSNWTCSTMTLGHRLNG